MATHRWTALVGMPQTWLGRTIGPFEATCALTATAYAQGQCRRFEQVLQVTEVDATDDPVHIDFDDLPF